MKSAKKSPLEISSGVTKRLTKELLSYKKELVTQSNRIESLKNASPIDTHMIKKQIQVLDETKEIIPDCISRLRKSVVDLEELMTRGEQGSADVEEANVILLNAQHELDVAASA
jgi:tubulin-specific chaperone A